MPAPKDSYDNNYFAITPSDTANLRVPTDAIWVGTSGSLVVLNSQGETITFANASGWMPIKTHRVMAATTATGLVGAVSRSGRG